MTEREMIEEMANDLLNAEHWRFGETSLALELDEQKTADNLYAAGYRKQVEGEWLLEECQVGLFGTDQYFVCSACKNEFFAEGLDYDDFVVTTKFCPNCGAKMKGGE